jgi:hypothetical protein
MKLNIRQLYLYLVSIISLVIVMIGAIQLIDLGLKVYVLKGADKIDYYAPVAPEGTKQVSEEQRKVDEDRQRKIQEEETIRQRQREVSNSVSMVVVGGLVYFAHQKMIKKEKKA